MDFSNIFTIIFIAFLILQIITKITLDIINYKHRKKNIDIIPAELEGHIDKEKLLKINKYSNEKLIFSMIEYFFDNLVLLLILFTGVLPLYYNFTQTITTNIYLTSFIFFGSYYLLNMILSIPFNLYFNFIIEKKYNFNKMTIKTWISDQIKALILTIILGGIILSAMIFFLYTFENIWWLLLWAFMAGFSFLMQIIYPSIIAPLFNKFLPLQNESLKIKIKDLFSDAKLKSSGIYEMDASKRSSHSNAYFTGIGKSKKVVLFDTLLNKLEDNEVLGVLAHEIGHFVKKHILKKVIASSLLNLAILFIANYLIKSSSLYNAFKFEETPLFIGLALLAIIAGPILFFFTPVGAFFSRKDEYEADNYAKEKTGNPEYLINALIKLNLENLSNIYPAKIFAAFYYSHPPLFERIRTLKKVNNQ